MKFETKDTGKFIVGSKKLIAIYKDNNLIPKNPTGRKGKRTINKGSIGGDTLDPFGEQNYVKTNTRTEVYLSQGSNEDVFPPPQFAVPKPQKKKAKKRKAKKEK